MKTLLVLAQQQHRAALWRWRDKLSDITLRVDYLDDILADGPAFYVERVVQQVRTGTRELDGVVGLSDLLASLALGGGL